MVDNLKGFFGYFVKYESITNLSSPLKSFDLESIVRRMKSFYVRQKNHELIGNMLSLKKNDMVNDFLIQVKQSHLASRKYLLNTYDITNPILQAFSAIDPVARGHTLTFTYLSKLFSRFKLILQDSTNSDYFDMIKKYQLDESLPVCTQESYPDIFPSNKIKKTVATNDKSAIVPPKPKKSKKNESVAQVTLYVFLIYC